MPAILKARTSTYEFSPEDVARLIAADLGVGPDRVAVDFVIREVGGDPIRDSPGRDTVVAIRVTVKEA